LLTIFENGFEKRLLTSAIAQNLIKFDREEVLKVPPQTFKKIKSFVTIYTSSYLLFFQNTTFGTHFGLFLMFLPIFMSLNP
jgi:hypothetical protein